jgi:peptide/nickel transport system substrate-binding protein
MSSPLKSLIATPDRDRGMGPTNPGGYSNPKVDALIDQALGTIDDSRRAALLAEASRTAMADHGLLPLHFEMTTWAMRRTLDYVARADQFTQATLVKPVK